MSNKISDLSPPLGRPSGPCQIVQRIEKNVRNPDLKEQLIDEVQHGDDLSNPEAAKIYSPIVESAGSNGLIKSIKITSHGQYRMDLRGITVENLQMAVGSLVDQFAKWKAENNPKARDIVTNLAMGGKIEWIDPRSNLKVVLQPSGRGEVTLVSTFWKGRPDPGPVNFCEKLALKYLGIHG